MPHLKKLIIKATQHLNLPEKASLHANQFDRVKLYDPYIISKKNNVLVVPLHGCVHSGPNYVTPCETMQVFLFISLHH